MGSYLCKRTTFDLFYFFICVVILDGLLLIRDGLTILRYYPQSVATKTHGFSIVVAAHNESHHLSQLIPELLRQNYPDFEIILVLDRCTDNSREELKNFSDPRLRILTIDKLPAGYDGKKYALTKGINAATREWVLLTDADCRPVSDQWILSFNNRIHAETEILLGISPLQKQPSLLNGFIQYETLQTALKYISAAIRHQAYMGVGRNLAYKKSLFMKAGGFVGYQQAKGGDDDLFVQNNTTQTNTEVVIGHESLTKSPAKRTLREYLTQKTRHLSVGKYYRSKLKKVHSIRFSIHLLVWVSFLYLTFSDSRVVFILGVFGVLMLIKGVIFNAVARKIGNPFSHWWIPGMDLLYSLGIPVIRARTLFVKSIRWT